MLAIAAAHLGLGLLVLRGTVIHRAAQPTPITVTVVPPPRSPVPLAAVPAIALVRPTVSTIPPPEVEIPTDAAPIFMPTAAASAPAAPASPAPAGAQRPSEATPPTMSEIAYLRQPAPHYPPVSRHAREEGLVVLQVTIDESGHVKSIVVYRSSGHARLDEAARDAVALALFKPYVAGGIARSAIAMIPIEFSLRGTSS